MVKRELENFFTQCLHLGDWLWEDTATSLTKLQVQGFITNDPALRVCDAMANTSKHHTRNKPGAMTARISTVATDATGVKVTITWSDGLKTGAEDALDLAQRCVASWAAFLLANGLRSPV